MPACRKGHGTVVTCCIHSLTAYCSSCTCCTEPNTIPSLSASHHPCRIVPLKRHTVSRLLSPTARDTYRACRRHMFLTRLVYLASLYQQTNVCQTQQLITGEHGKQASKPSSVNYTQTSQDRHRLGRDRCCRSCNIESPSLLFPAFANIVHKTINSLLVLPGTRFAFPSSDWTSAPP